MPTLLELFSGTHSIGKAFAELGWDVVSLDNDPATNPTICCDIMCWDYKVFPPDAFQHVHASPPCTMYSIARTRGGPRDLFSADTLVERAKEIITYFSAASYSIENPSGGAYTLEKRGLLDDMPLFPISYCKFESPDHPYRKNTSIWSDLPLQMPPPCRKGSRCSIYSNGGHPSRAQRGTSANPTDRSHSLSQLHSMPPQLCRIIAGCATHTLVHS